MSNDPTLVDYYAQRAAEYERIYDKPERQGELRQLKDFVRGTFAGRHVMEIACGTGYWTQVAAETATSVVASDLNEPVLEIARRKPIDSRKVTFRVGDAYRPQPPTPPCDALLSAFWWSHIPREQLTAFLHGLRPVLTPGSVVVFLDNNFVSGNSTPLSRTDSSGNTYQRRTLEDGRTYEVLKNFPTDEELLTIGGEWLGERRVKRLKYYWWLEGRAQSAGEAIDFKESKSTPSCS